MHCNDLKMRILLIFVASKSYFVLRLFYTAVAVSGKVERS